MGTRSRQRAATRGRIVDAAAEAFAEKGFRGASTRDIARRADANQGLITYHFRTEDELWRAAADRIFGILRAGRSRFADLRRRAGVSPPDGARSRDRRAVETHAELVARFLVP